MFNPFHDEYLFGNSVNSKFKQVFPDAETFVNEYNNSPLSADVGKIKNPELVYYLLMSRYANSTIAAASEERFKYDLFSTIFMYGPAWERRLEIQHEIIGTDIDEAVLGSQRIINRTNNPSTPPGPDAFHILSTVDDQTVDGWKKNKLDGYENLLMLIDTDVTEEFIGKFNKLFIKVAFEYMPWYI
ncbi:MAG: hypothetical protein J6A25_09385 [Lachnospiraceae bacterium]|nr:hypothetical protein [Lachnospiraceae bacterium]